MSSSSGRNRDVPYTVSRGNRRKPWENHTRANYGSGPYQMAGSNPKSGLDIATSDKGFLYG